jgi:hypothetical protein
MQSVSLHEAAHCRSAAQAELTSHAAASLQHISLRHVVQDVSPAAAGQLPPVGAVIVGIAHSDEQLAALQEASSLYELTALG